MEKCETWAKDASSLYEVCCYLSRRSANLKWLYIVLWTTGVLNVPTDFSVLGTKSSFFSHFLDSFWSAGWRNVRHASTRNEMRSYFSERCATLRSPLTGSMSSPSVCQVSTTSSSELPNFRTRFAVSCGHWDLTMFFSQQYTIRKTSVGIRVFLFFWCTATFLKYWSFEQAIVSAVLQISLIGSLWSHDHNRCFPSTEYVCVHRLWQQHAEAHTLFVLRQSIMGPLKTLTMSGSGTRSAKL